MGRNFSAAVILFFLFAGPAGLRAEGAETAAPLPPELGAGMPGEKLREILERTAGNRQKTWGIRFKNAKESSFRPRIKIPWMEFFQKAGAWVLRGILVLAAAALILAAGIYAGRRRGRFRPGPQPSAVPLQNPAETPPPLTLLEEARRLAGRGSFREAWALCYAASLEALKLRWGFRFPPGATEYRCLALVRLWAGQGRMGPGDSAGHAEEAAFAGFIRRWVAFFYGGILPPAGALEEALAWVESLCEMPAPLKKPAAGGLHD